MVQHHKSSLYHPQANGTVEAFNKILEKGLAKICNAKCDDWDERLSAALWAYRTTVKRLTNQTPFQLVYGWEAVIPAEFIVPSLLIATSLKFSEEASLQEHLHELQELDEARFLVEFHQKIQKDRQKVWHDCHIKKKTFQVGGKVILYDNRFQKFPRKLQMHWLGPYFVIEIRDSGAVRLAQLDGMVLPRWVNGACLKPYQE